MILITTAKKAIEMSTQTNVQLSDSEDTHQLEPEGDLRPGSGYMLREVEKHTASAPKSLLNRLKRTEFPEQVYMSRAAKSALPNAVASGRPK